MRLSEIIIIYLATAAPVGVAFFLRRPAGASRLTPLLAQSVGVALLWPLTMLPLLFPRLRFGARREVSAGASSRLAGERRIEEAKRSLISAINATEDFAEKGRVEEAGEAERHAFFAARESVERYAGLSLAAADVEQEAEPSESEMELCRLAGRAGDDLLLAGRCIHRRNVSRLLAHRRRARAELLQALASLRMASKQEHDETTMRRLSELLLCVFSRAVELFSHLDDAQAALAAARLLDTECARLHRHETESEAAPLCAHGEEPCTTPARLNTPGHNTHPTMPRPTLQAASRPTAR